MKDETYPWQRLWVPGTGIPDMLVPATCTIPPAGAAPLAHWQATPCLVLLGESGMGKSAEWKRQRAEPAPGASAYFPLGDAGRGKQIRKALGKLPQVKNWLRHPGTDLWLWLDGYDEALLYEAKLAPALLRQLAKWPTAGLHLRILSRTATWPAFFTK